MPAEVILELALGLRPQGLDRMAEIAGLELLLEPGHAAVVDQILHPGMAPLLPVTVVALQGQDRLHQIQQVFAGYVAEGVGRAGEGFLLVVGAAHATAHVDVAALGSALGIAEQHQADVLGEQVDRVVPGNGDGHFEFARQIGGPIERFAAVAAENSALQLPGPDCFYAVAGLDPVTELAVHPDVEVGAFGCLGGQQVGDVIGQLAGGRVGTFLKGCGRSHHIAVDVPTGREGGAELAHDRADHLLEVFLVDAVHLEGLAGGGPQGAIAEPVGQLVDCQIEPAWNPAAGVAQPQHHLPILFLPLAAVVTVVLLVAAVKFQDLDRAITEIGSFVAEFPEQRLLQVAAVGLELFKFRRGL